MQLPKLRKTVPLDDYAAFAELHRAVEELRAEAAMLAPRLRGRKVWMINSAAQGGGGAEMLPMQVLLLRALGVNTHWAVITTSRGECFKLTMASRRHNARYDVLAGTQDGLPGKEGTFSMCSFWYVGCLARAGDLKQARFIFEKALGFANHLGLYAEELGLRGEHLGNFPQAFTHLALISAAFNMDRRQSAANVG
jgi:hypothetical protein